MNDVPLVLSVHTANKTFIQVDIALNLVHLVSWIKNVQLPQITCYIVTYFVFHSGYPLVAIPSGLLFTLGNTRGDLMLAAGANITKTSSGFNITLPYLLLVNLFDGVRFFVMHLWLWYCY
jgi:hypothetical protein